MLSRNIVRAARDATKKTNRSVIKQLEHWISIGRVAEANPDLTYDFIQKIVAARKEAQVGLLEPYTFNLD